jgi:predicted lipase
VAGKTFSVLKTIYSNDLATLINPTRPTTEGFKTIGIVARNDADQNEVVIAIRGTSTVWEWVQDAKFLQRPFSNVSGAGLTEDGFTDMYQSFSFLPDGGGGLFMQNLANLLTGNSQVTITGHSLGGALATLLSMDFAAHTPITLATYTIASPMTGDLVFANLFNHIVPDCYRVANQLDLVPKLPVPLVYVPVGDETSLNPIGVKFDILCEHHITTYLALLARLIGMDAAYPIESDCQTGSTGVAPSADPSTSKV